jgi:dUTP pyrophosphatase
MWQRLRWLLGLPVKVAFWSDHGVVPPQYHFKGDAGADLRAAINRPITLEPGEIKVTPTGFKVDIPSGFEIQIRPRSGLSIRHGITVVNSPGTIDSGYRDYVKIPLINLGDKPFTVERGMRVAQMVLAPMAQCKWHGVGSLAESERGEGGFGSTGK